MQDESVISENEPIKNELKKPQQSPEEKKLVKKINTLLHMAKTHREKYDRDWVSNYRMFRGDQWEVERPDYRHSEVINLIFQNIQSIVPIMTDSRPRFEYLPQEPSDLEFSEFLNDLAESDWKRQNWLEVLTEMIYDSHFYGTALGEIGFDPDALFGLGEITFKSTDPFYCFPDPDSWAVNVNSEYFIHAEPMTLKKIKRKWSKGKYVKADVDDSTEEDKTDVIKTRIKNPESNYIAFERDRMLKLDEEKKALVITVYMKDDEFLEESKVKKVKEKNENGEEIEKEEISFVQKLKYPKGRKVVMANNIILHDDKNPYDDGKFPFAKMVNYLLPREFWGESEIKQLKSPQMIFNKLVSFTLDVLTLMGNPIWLVDTTSGVDTDNIFNRPGEIIEKEPGSEVRRVEGTQLQPYVLQVIDRMKLWFDDISGANDVTRGATPTGVSAASAIISLQEAAKTRIRQKSRNMDSFLQNIGQMYLSRVLQFYTAPRVVRLTGNDGATQYFKFSVEKGEGEKKTAVITPILVNSEEKTSVELPTKRLEINGLFDVRVSTGSMLPFSKAEKEQKLLNFYDRGIIDREEVLKGVDYPNAEAVLQRVLQKEQAAAQAQAQQANLNPNYTFQYI